MTHLRAEDYYRKIVDGRLTDTKISRVKDAVNAVVDVYVTDNQGVIVTGYTRNFIATAVFGIKQDPSNAWIEYDHTNNNQAMRAMSTTISRIPQLLDEVSAGKNSSGIRITYADVLHSLDKLLDKICPMKKSR